MSTKNQSLSYQLVKLWQSLYEIKHQIENTALPLGGHLAIEDPELMIALDVCAARIGQHLDSHRLQAVKGVNGVLAKMK